MLYLKKTFTLWAVHTHTHTRTGSREEWALYWYLRQGGKNIFLPIFLSEVNGQHPSPPHSLPPTLSPPRLPHFNFSLPLSPSPCLPPTLLFLCVGEPCRERRPTGSLSRCRCAQRLLIVTSCAPASESCKVKEEFVCVTERQLLKTQRGHQMFPS